MKFVAGLLLAIGLVGVNSWSLPRSFHKIIGGSDVTKGEHPHQVHLARTVSYFGLFEFTSFGCAGTIIDKNWILTAAHCVSKDDPKLPIVRVGQHDSSIQEAHAKNYQGLEVIQHEGYVSNDFVNDIALIRVADIAFTEHVQPIALPAQGYVPADGTTLIVTGWGETIPNGRVSFLTSGLQAKAAAVILQATQVDVVNKEKCNSKQSYDGIIGENMLCAGAKGFDSCQGDSGGPLIQQDAEQKDRVVVGVVSFGYGCGAEGYPGIYTNTGSYVNWIHEKTGLSASA